MEVRFTCPKLESLEGDEETCEGAYSIGVANKYRRIMNIIRSALNEHDFRSMRSLYFKKLKGKRDHEHSFRINDQWRLIVEIESNEEGNIIHIKKIEDYHK